ncbi:hypothetical protein V1477_005114, partial [Vespula maculifrons]
MCLAELSANIKGFLPSGTLVDRRVRQEGRVASIDRPWRVRVQGRASRFRVCAVQTDDRPDGGSSPFEINHTRSYLENDLTYPSDKKRSKNGVVEGERRVSILVSLGSIEVWFVHLLPASWTNLLAQRFKVIKRYSKAVNAI